MSYVVGQAEVIVVPNADRFNQALAAQLNPAAKQAGEKFGDDFAASVQDKVKKSKPVDMPTPDTKKSDAEVDRFLRDFNAKMKKEYDKTGQDSGNALANGLRLSFLRNSPLIAAAVGGGLIAGAPVAIAGAGVLFAGIAAVAEKNNVDLQASAKATGTVLSTVFSDAASSTVPMFEDALGRVRIAVQDLEPQLASAFGSLGGPIDSLTTGVLALVNNAMPGLVAAVRNAGPVFAGLSSLLSEIGTGLGQFFQLVGAHGAQAGAVFQALGQAVGAILPILGELMGAGVQLGSQILPPLADALSLVAKVVQVIGPALPAVVAGFGGLMIARSLQGPLQTLAQNLAFASYQGGALGKTAGAASSAVSGLANGLPIAGFVLGTFMDVQARATDQAKQWATALLQGGNAADTASAQMSNFGVAMRTTNSGFEGVVTGLVGFGAQVGVTGDALSKVKDQQKQLTDSMSPLAKAQADVTQKTNDYLTLRQKYGADSGQAVGAAVALRDAQDRLSSIQGVLNDVTGAGADVTAKLKSNLQYTADAASQANSQIRLLKDSLDALTGKTVTMGDAEVAVTDATLAATTALKGKTGALVDGTGALNLHTEAGAAAWQALTQLASADNQLIGTMEQQGATTDQVRTRDGQLRDSFIQTAEKMGFSASQAQNLANQIYGIPSDRTTQITANTGPASNAVKVFQEQIDALHGTTVTVSVNADHTAGVILGSASQMSRPGFKVGYAQGGVIPGYAPGVDSVHAMLSPGEGVLVPEAVRSLGGLAGIQAINSAFSSRVPHFANGGVVGKTILANVIDNLLPVMQAVSGGLASQAAVGSAGGAARWANLVLQALAMEGQPASLLGITLARMNQESGGNPNAINLWDSNAAAGDPSRGLMQTIGSTFARYHFGGTSWNIYDPLANVLASMNYALARYGSLAAAYGRVGGYDSGGVWPSGTLGYNGSGGDELVVPRQNFQQVVQSADGSPGRSTGPLMQVQHMHVGDQVDLELALQQAEFRQRAGVFS